MSLTRVPLKDFRGGLNTRDSPFELQANESPDLSNVTISALVGQLEARKGKTRYDVSGLPEGETVDNAKECVLGTGTRVLLLSINGGVWYCNTAGEVKKIHAGTAGVTWSFEVFSDLAFKDWVYMSNGQDIPQKWDGVTAATVEWAIEKGALPNGKVLKVWENRMFISQVTAAPQRVYFSEFGDPQAGVKEYGFVDVRAAGDDLDTVQDLAVLGARLIVLKRRDVFFISSAVTMANRRIGSPGVWAPFQTVELEDKLYFINPQGIFSTGGVEVSMESGSINNYFKQTVNKAALERARVVATRDTYPRLMIAVPTGSNTSNDTLIEMVPHINFRRIGGRRYLLLPAFFLHTLPATALACWNPTGTEELLIGAGSANLAPGTVFPNLAISDSFERAPEKPLNNAGMWVLLENIAEAARPYLVSNKVSLPFSEAGGGKLLSLKADTRDTSSEFTNPAVEIEIAELTANELYTISLYCCLAAEAKMNNGYQAQFITPTIGEEEKGAKPRIEITRRVAGVPKSLAVVNLPRKLEKGMRLGITVQGGKIKAWWNVAGKGWELLGEVADASFNKGYSGFGITTLSEPGIAVKNFRTGVIPTQVGRLSTLFTGTTDEGAEISAHWHSSWMALQGDEPKERVRRLNVELQGDGILDVFTDFSEFPRFSSTIPKGVAEGSEYRFERVRPETFGRFHSIKLRSLPGGQPFLVNAMEVVYRGGKEH